MAMGPWFWPDLLTLSYHMLDMAFRPERFGLGGKNRRKFKCYRSRWMTPSPGPALRDAALSPKGAPGQLCSPLLGERGWSEGVFLGPKCNGCFS
jgi:hypothetical protein